MDNTGNSNNMIPNQNVNPMGSNAGGLNLGNAGKGCGCLGLSAPIIALLVIVGGLFLWGIAQYNGLVTQEEDVEKAWANVENTYQRRADLIPNLVNTVKGYAKHEKETFEAVTNARASVGQVKVDAGNITEEDLQKYQQAQGELGTALGKLIAVSEGYPELKANENFMNLQTQLEGTENRCTKAREDFNAAAQTYNTKVRRFPLNLVANLFGFKVKPHFKAAPGSDKAPTVSFD